MFGDRWSSTSAASIQPSSVITSCETVVIVYNRNFNRRCARRQLLAPVNAVDPITLAPCHGYKPRQENGPDAKIERSGSKPRHDLDHVPPPPQLAAAWQFSAVAIGSVYVDRTATRVPSLRCFPNRAGCQFFDETGLSSGAAIIA
jgi:hypothetical protein